MDPDTSPAATVVWATWTEIQRLCEAIFRLPSSEPFLSILKDVGLR